MSSELSIINKPVGDTDKNTGRKRSTPSNFNYLKKCKVSISVKIKYLDKNRKFLFGEKKTIVLT